MQISGTPATINGLPASVGTLIDITEQKVAENKIRELADFDPLTGLPNRRSLRDRFTQMLAIAERDKSEMALIFLISTTSSESMIRSVTALAMICYVLLPNV